MFNHCHDKVATPFQLGFRLQCIFCSCIHQILYLVLLDHLMLTLKRDNLILTVLMLISGTKYYLVFFYLATYMYLGYIAMYLMMLSCGISGVI